MKRSKRRKKSPWLLPWLDKCDMGKLPHPRYSRQYKERRTLWTEGQTRRLVASIRQALDFAPEPEFPVEAFYLWDNEPALASNPCLFDTEDT